MTQPGAKILLDSVNRDGDRITTVEVTHHRFILAETNTHGAISKNSASSRAIPLSKMLHKFGTDPAYPAAYRAEQGGMTAGGELEGDDLAQARNLFLSWNTNTAELIEDYIDLLETLHGDSWKQHALHKSWVNRLMEPMQWHTAIWTFDHNLFYNFVNQRLHEDAQPEFYELAKALVPLLEDSEPQTLGHDQWHMPLLREEDEGDIWELAEEFTRSRPGEVQKIGPIFTVVQDLKRKISVARCARVSYLTHEGTRDISKDIELHDRLAGQNPPHASPFEHVCTPAPWNKQTVAVPQLNNFSRVKTYTRPKVGKFYGWLQMRHAIGMP